MPLDKQHTIIYKATSLISQLKDYNSKTLLIDLRAGLTVGVLLIPQAMAYSMLAGMPPIYGLYAGLIPLILYAFLGTSRQLSVGPVAISSILILSGVATISTPGSPDYISYVLMAGVLIGVVQLALGVMRLGFLSNFLSQPVISGFMTAAAVIILASQLKDILGINTPQTVRGISNFKYSLEHYNETHIVTLIVFFIAIVIMTLMKRIWSSFPTALVIIFISTILSYVLNWNNLGVAIVGEIPKGLPDFYLPDFSFDRIQALLPTVATVSLIGIVECIAIAKSLESKTNDHIVDTNKELIAIGISKIGGSFLQALPSSASFSRSAVNNRAGAKTQLSSIFTALLVLLTLLFLTPLFFYMPIAILSAIIFQSVIGLIDLKEIKNLWNTDKKDLLMLLVTLVITVTLGIDYGILAGVILSLIIVLYQSSVPQISILGSVPGSTHYRNLERFEDVQLIEDTLILRFENQLYFGNAGFFKDEIRKLVANQKIDIHHIILDATSIHNIDSSGIKALKAMDQELEAQNIDLYLAGARGVLRDKLHRNGLMSESDKHYLTIHDAVEFIHKKIVSDHNYRAIQANR